MKPIKLLIITLGTVTLFNGCSNKHHEIMQKGTYDPKQYHVVEYGKDADDGEERYYLRPDHTWSYKLDKSNAHINTVSSGGILSCKEHDIWYISMNERAKQGQIRYNYLISLAKSQLDDMKDDPSYIPRRESEEFYELMRIDTELAQQGLIGCRSPLPQEYAEEIKKNKEDSNYKNNQTVDDPILYYKQLKKN